MNENTSSGHNYLLLESPLGLVGDLLDITAASNIAEPARQPRFNGKTSGMSRHVLSPKQLDPKQVFTQNLGSR